MSVQSCKIRLTPTHTSIVGQRHTSSTKSQGPTTIPRPWHYLEHSWHKRIWGSKKLKQQLRYCIQRCTWLKRLQVHQYHWETWNLIANKWLQTTDVTYFDITLRKTSGIRGGEIERADNQRTLSKIHSCEFWTESTIFWQLIHSSKKQLFLVSRYDWFFTVESCERYQQSSWHRDKDNVGDNGDNGD